MAVGMGYGRPWVEQLRSGVVVDKEGHGLVYGCGRMGGYRQVLLCLPIERHAIPSPTGHD